jgi:hypothetical protein
MGWSPAALQAAEKPLISTFGCSGNEFLAVFDPFR